MSPLIRISVITPCFNQGEFLTETVDSVLNLKRDDIELIVVDDGSTDGQTIREVEALCARGITVIRQANGGVGAARNTGIRASRGRYFFPLDSDDLLRGNWIDRGIELLERNPRTGVVYGDCQFFGALTSRWRTGPLNLEQLLRCNYIPTSALIRRCIWDENSGYDPTMPVQGYEDWDFWLGAVERGWEFSYLPDIFFDYRKAAESMLTRGEGRKSEVEDFIAKKHGALYRQEWLRHLDDRLSITRTASRLTGLVLSRARSRMRSLFA